jgi:hypothetical protein
MMGFKNKLNYSKSIFLVKKFADCYAYDLFYLLSLPFYLDYLDKKYNKISQCWKILFLIIL